MAGLTTAALLTKNGLKVLVLEANYLPGGCTSSYFRKGYWFEAGATTLVGLGNGMPLQHVLDETGININAWHLDTPMQVHMAGEVLTRYEKLDRWIAEATRVWGGGQQQFWEQSYKISQFVWRSALKQLRFPPENMGDIIHTVGQASFNQIKYLPLAFKSTEKMLHDYGHQNKSGFRAFVDEQLMITAQNIANEVNQLFGATALCYTNYPNYYVPGGLINLVAPFVDYLINNGSDYRSRQPVTAISETNGHYSVSTPTHTFTAPKVVSALPINNTLPLLKKLERPISNTWTQLTNEKLNSAYQLSLVFKRQDKFPSIHHQIHLDRPLPGLNSGSIFLSMNHPEDEIRAPVGLTVGSVTTHISLSSIGEAVNQEQVNRSIIKVLVQKGFLKPEDIVHHHSADQHAWERWTRRKFGFVGGYPQFMQTKPWQMNGNRLIDNSFYVCGDSTYPGQGIPGVTLSGIITANKLLSDA